MAHMLRGGPSMGSIARDSAPSMADIAFRQQMAQMLMQQGQQQPQAQMVGGRYIPPNAGQVIANALSGISGYQMMRDTNRDQYDLMQRQDEQMRSMFGVGGGQPQAGAQGQGAGQQGMQSPQGSPMPTIPGMSPQQSYMLARNIGLPEYMKLAAQQSAPTEQQRNLAAAGFAPGSPEYQRALSASVNRPINVAPGGTMVDPVTGRPTFTAAQGGIQTSYGPDGVAQSFAVPGYAGAQAQITGAEAIAREQAAAQQDLVVVKMADGSERQMPRSEAINLTGSQAAGVGVTPSNMTKNANRAIELISEARSILPNASSGALSNVLTRGSEVAGISTKSSQADAQLKTLAGQLVSMMPRMEGPQSDRDVQMYQQMAGDIANPNLPIETRLASLETIERLQQKYAPRGGFQQGATPGAQPSGGGVSSGDFSSLWGG